MKRSSLRHGIKRSDRKAIRKFRTSSQRGTHGKLLSNDLATRC